MRLTPANLGDRCPGQNLRDVKDINCSGMGITHIDDISFAVNLRKLDLSENDIRHADALSGIKYNMALSYLTLKGNKLETLEGFSTLKNLTVLNLSFNEVTRISSHIQSCTSLKALILNNNSITVIENLTKLTKLNTIVLSHNKIDAISGLGSLAELTKLSVAHNNIHQFPDLTKNSQIREIRLNDNKISSIPETIRFLPSLEILDLGKNQIATFADIAPLSSLIKLTHLNLKGNPICEKENYRESILKMLPSLRILDGDRFDPKFQERKKKRESMKIKKIIKEKKSQEREKATAEPVQSAQPAKVAKKRKPVPEDEDKEVGLSGEKHSKPAAEKRPKPAKKQKLEDAPAKPATPSTFKGQGPRPLHLLGTEPEKKLKRKDIRKQMEMQAKETAKVTKDSKAAAAVTLTKVPSSKRPLSGERKRNSRQGELPSAKKSLKSTEDDFFVSEPSLHPKPRMVSKPVAGPQSARKPDQSAANLEPKPPTPSPASSAPSFLAGTATVPVTKSSVSAGKADHHNDSDRSGVVAVINAKGDKGRKSGTVQATSAVAATPFDPSMLQPTSTSEFSGQGGWD
ncbi:uncharacterized protein BJ171DRAFT_453769 [Polychytrium aggregatum]|uniref:uncharacterized protein n=1 Tax=Polychytrium aggregatum TaxID=110093 RepID=UPI0022FDE953|nr:uncharacterized protein BJ171DRAFT_453769 [Polychytrium aggregatum]KAI9209618.1 hypothetical protein BJ171DRAFT_453769 [Polychytrium aggregatum]